MTGGAGGGEEEARERAGYSVRGQNARQSATRRCARSSSDNLPRTRRMFALAKTASLCTLAGSSRMRRMIALIEQHRAALAALCRRFKVRRLDLFGSAAKGTFDPQSSDLDFLVSLDDTSPADYTDNYFGLANELERLLQRRVDLVTERSVRNPYFRQVIEATRQPVYEG